jgi:uncharacterized protein (TIGR02996 family)
VTDPDDAALLAELAAHPEDDSLRLVWADRLQARGDPRGEFIAIQCQQREHNTSGHQARAGELERAHGERWKREAGVDGALTTWLRGFPSNLIGSCSKVVASAQALRTQPITTLVLMGEWESLSALATLSGLERITTLELAGEKPIPAKHLQALADCPRLTHVRTLHLSRAALDDEASAVLSTAPWLRTVTTFLAGANFTFSLPMTGAGLARLIAQMTSLETTWLEGAPLGEAGLRALWQRPRLKDADLSRASFPDQWLRSLFTSPALASLRRLVLTHADPSSVQAFALMPTQLEELRLCHCGVSDDAVPTLANSTALARLQTLDLRDNRLSNAAVEAFVEGRGLPALTRLGLSGNAFRSGRKETIFVPPTEQEICSGDASSHQVEQEILLGPTDLQARFTHRPGLSIF